MGIGTAGVVVAAATSPPGFRAKEVASRPRPSRNLTCTSPTLGSDLVALNGGLRCANPPYGLSGLRLLYRFGFL